MQLTELLGTGRASPDAPPPTLPYDLALNAPEGLLYWSDAEQNVINVMRLDGSKVGVIVSGGGGQKPRSIALAVDKGLVLFFFFSLRELLLCCDDLYNVIIMF